MAQFHIHPDGIVYIRTPKGIYVDTSANFARDYGTALPAFPIGVVQALYDSDGKVVQLFDAQNNQVGTGRAGDWEFADAAIASVCSLLTAQAKRIAPAPKIISPATATGIRIGSATMAS